MNSNRHYKHKRSFLTKIGLALVSLFVAVPLYATFVGGFKELGELRAYPFSFPRNWDFSRFLEIMYGDLFIPSLLNSLVVAIATVFLTVMLSSMIAFTFAHMKYFGRKMLMSYMLLGLLFPAAAAVLPLFLVLRNIGLLDTLLGLVLAQTAFSLSLSILLFYNFFSKLPDELIEAARMDNCGYVRIYLFITLPLSLPIIATVGVFAFVASWNNFLLPLVSINSPEKYTWPLGIMQFRGEYGTDWPSILAYLTLTILPAVAFFLMMQKYIVSGLTGGSVKG
ncbi:MAG: carbohydrate ABC transporter permease [Gammaproteobacteria bacterium]|nr:carbohydrate ABC transporter permease [Gammaproteobacteria bacterium]